MSKNFIATTRIRHDDTVFEVGDTIEAEVLNQEQSKALLESGSIEKAPTETTKKSTPTKTETSPTTPRKWLRMQKKG